MVSDSLMLFKGGKNNELAWQFLHATASPQVRVEFTTKEGFLPVTKVEADAPIFTNDPQLKAFTDMLPYAHFALAHSELGAGRRRNYPGATARLYETGDAKRGAERRRDVDRRHPQAIATARHLEGARRWVHLGPPRQGAATREGHVHRSLHPDSAQSADGALDNRVPDLGPDRHVVALVTRFGQLKDYSGFANFSKLIAEPLFFECLIRTLVWTFAVVGGTVLLSIPIALILADDFIGRQVLRVIIMLPWAVSLTMSGIVWRWALNGQSGMVNATLYDFGAIGSRSPGSPQQAQPFRSRSRSAFSFRSRSQSRYFWAAYPHSLARYSRPPACPAPAAGSAGGFYSPADPPIHQHRSRPKFHLRLQFLSAHLGDDLGILPTAPIS